jgi:hypothetical protein
MSFCATGKVCPMRSEKKIVLELPDYYVTISFRPKTTIMQHVTSAAKN